MGVGGKNMDEPLFEHALGPIAGALAKTAEQGPGGDLHPNPPGREPDDHGVVAFDPGEPLGMGEDRDIAPEQNAEKQILKAGGGDMMRRLDKHIGCTGKRQKPPILQGLNEIWHDVIVGARDEFEPDTGIIEMRLQL